MNKELRKLVAFAEGIGYEIEETKGKRGHLMAKLPGTNVLVTISGTPSCPRALRNARSMLRRSAQLAVAA